MSQDTSSITTTVEIIDKVQAQEYMTKNIPNGNRPISQSHLNQLIGRQKRGEWQTNGDCIRFDWDGNLRDGQHRLMMIQINDTPIQTVVVRGIDPRAFMTMDSGKNRTITDVLSILKQPNPRYLAGALQWTYRYLANRMYGKVESHEVLLSVLEKHPDIHETVQFYQTLSQPPGAPGKHDIAMGAHYLFSQVNKASADTLIEGFVTGSHLLSTNDPIAKLRGQVVALASPARRPLDGGQILALFVSAWNVHYGARRLTAAKTFRAPPRNSSRPMIEGFPDKLFIDSQLYFQGFDDDED